MRVGILLSGRGSNMQALVAAMRDGRIRATPAVILSNREEAAGLAWAREHGLPAVAVPQRSYPDRPGHDAAVLAELRAHSVEVVCLAGYMRLLGPDLVRAFPNRILNVHPSLLPAFPGLEAQRQAWDHGVKVTGATVHLVDELLDHGPILAQEAVTVDEGDSAETLAARILQAEHRVYPRALALVCAGRVRVVGRRCQITEEPS